VPVQISSQLLKPGTRWQLTTRAGMAYVQQFSEERLLAATGQYVPVDAILASRDLPVLLGA